MPPQEPDTLFDNLLQDLPADFQHLAFEHKSFARSRKIASPAELLRIVLLYCALDQSLRQVAGTHSLLTANPISDTAILGRLLSCQDWIKAILKQMLDYSAIKGLSNDRRLVVVDSSDITGPGAKGSQYRVHLALELMNLQLLQLEVTDYKGAESLRRFQFQPSDIVLGDRAYARREAVIESVQSGIDVVLRFSPQLCNVTDRQGRPIDWEKTLSQAEYGSYHSWQVCLRDDAGQQLNAVVHGYRLTQAQAEVARRKCRRARRKSKQIRRLTLQLCEWVLVLTTLDPKHLDGETILELYRLRWQIEVAIKRCKSILDMDKLRVRKNKELAHVWLLGKLLYVMIIDRRARRRCGYELQRLDKERRQTCWRIWKMLKLEVATIIAGSAFWQERDWKQCIKAMCERRRKPRLQQVSKAVISYLQTRIDINQQPLVEAA